MLDICVLPAHDSPFWWPHGSWCIFRPFYISRKTTGDQNQNLNYSPSKVTARDAMETHGSPLSMPQSTLDAGNRNQRHHTKKDTETEGCLCHCDRKRGRIYDMYIYIYTYCITVYIYIYIWECHLEFWEHILFSHSTLDFAMTPLTS